MAVKFFALPSAACLGLPKTMISIELMVPGPWWEVLPCIVSVLKSEETTIISMFVTCVVFLKTFYNDLTVVPHKAVAEVSKIGNL